MPAKLKLDARCPVCNESIDCISRVTSRNGTVLEFCHTATYLADHKLFGDDETMSTIFDRLSSNDTKPPEVAHGG